MSSCYRQTIVFLLLVLLGGYWLFGAFLKGALAFGQLPTSVEILLSCGDGFAEHLSGEICDPGDPPAVEADLGTTTCADYDDIFGNPFVQGDMDCLDDCSDYDIDGCYTCGNTNKEFTEGCDTNDFGGATCISLGFDSGNLLCTLDCQVSVAGCVAMEEEPGEPGTGPSGGSSGGTSGYFPGSETEDETKVIVIGKSYPHSDVHMLLDGRVTGIVRTDAKADFYFESTEIPSGVANFSFWSEDVQGLKSTLLTLTFRVTLGAVTTITGVYIAPTIDVNKKSVRQGDDIIIFGQTIPDTDVEIYIHSDQEFIEQTESQEDGNWELTFDTEPLDVDFHTAKALFQIETGGNIIKSGFSKTISFAISKFSGEALCPEADLNGDGRVNLTDFSILLFHWGTDDACADQNQNGVVDLVDFSIMMYYWTG